MEHIGVEVALRGADAVIAQLKEIDAYGNKIDKKKYKAEIVDPSIKEVGRAVDNLNSKTRNFRRTVRAIQDHSGAIRTNLYRTTSQMRTLGQQYREMVRIRRAYDSGQIKASAQQIARHRELTQQYKGQIGYLNHQRRLYKDLLDYASKGNIRQTLGAAYEYNRKAAETTREMRRSFDEIPVKGRTVFQTYSLVSRGVSHLGASLTTLGNTMTRISTPFSALVRGGMYTLGYSAINKVTEGLSSSFSRYDTIKTYPRIMRSLGFSSKQAESSIQKLNDAVDGLPTGLDEIVDMAKRYSLATGSIKKGTDVAIATNNAFLASAATETQRYQGMMQINDVLAGKKLQTREWMSLAASMPAAMNEIARYLGYADNSKFLQDLYGNKIPNKKFLKALTKVGTETGKIAQMATISKMTFSGLASNIKNAFSRGGFKLLDALDSIIAKNSKYKNTVDMFVDWKKGIDGLFDSAVKWMNANPDKIMGFFEKVRSFDWMGLAAGFGDGVKWLIEWTGRLSDIFAGGDASKLGRMMVKWNIIGRAISVFGGFTKGLAPFLGGISVIPKILVGGKLAKLVKALSSIGKAKGAVKGAKTLGEVGTAVSGAALTWQGVASKALSIAAIPAMAGSMYLAAKALQEFDKVNLSPGLIGKIGVGMGAIAAFLAEAAGIGVLLASNPIGWLTTASAALGGVSMAGLAGVMYSVGKGLNSIANAKLPSAKKVKSTVNKMKEVLIALADVGKDLPPQVRGNAKNALGLGNVFDALIKVGEDLPKIAKLEITKKQIKAASKSIRAMKPAIDSIKDAVAEIFGDEIVSTKQIGGQRDRRVTSRKRNTFDQSSLTDAVEAVSNMMQLLSSVQTMVDQFRTFKKSFKKLEKLGDVSEIGQNISDMMEQVNNIAFKFSASKSNYKDIDQAPENMQNLVAALGEIPKVISKIQSISKAMEGGKNGEGVDIGKTLDSVFLPLNQRLGQIQTLTPKVEALSVLAVSLRTALDNLSKASSIEIDLTAFSTTISTTVSEIQKGVQSVRDAMLPNPETLTKRMNIKFKKKISGQNAVVSAVRSAIAAIKTAIANLPSDIYKAVHVHISRSTDVSEKNGSGGGGGGSFHTGGFVNGKGRPVYLAKGGVLMYPKGTDTVPAMLTPGEYVQNRKAVDYFGVKFMQKLNNLDLEGALRSVSVRASRSLSQPMRSVVNNNITNKTNNARVNQTIYTNNQNYTFRRANRFVGAL